MREIILAWLLVFLSLAGLVMALVVICSYASYSSDSFSNQLDVSQHLANVTTVNFIVHGQTVRFNTFGDSGDQFNFWLQAMQQYNITTVYYVPRSDWAIIYNGAALYFTYKGVIYLYQ